MTTKLTIIMKLIWKKSWLGSPILTPSSHQAIATKMRAEKMMRVRKTRVTPMSSMTMKTKIHLKKDKLTSLPEQFRSKHRQHKIHFMRDT